MGETVYSFGADFPSEPFCTGNTLCGANVTINAAAWGANVFSKKSFVLGPDETRHGFSFIAAFSLEVGWISRPISACPGVWAFASSFSPLLIFPSPSLPR